MLAGYEIFLDFPPMIRRPEFIKFLKEAVFTIAGGHKVWFHPNIPLLPQGIVCVMASDCQFMETGSDEPVLGRYGCVGVADGQQFRDESF